MGKKVTVSQRALIQRINRALKKEHQAVKIPRGQRMQQDVGDYYLLDYSRNFVVNADRYGLDLESFARELEVMEDWEALETD